MSNSENKKKRRAWPEKRRKQQAENIRKTKPWKHTTGPRTDAGKDAAKYNAIKQGLHTAEMNELRRVLSLQKRWLKSCFHLAPPP